MIKEQVKAAVSAQKKLFTTDNETRNSVLQLIISTLDKEKDRIFTANKQDLEEGKKNGLAAPLMKRLKFDEDKLFDVCSGLQKIISMQDPLNKIMEKRELDTDLILEKITSPIGVIGMIFESRPDALIQIASLCLKSGNAVVLKGGSEAIRTNKVLTECIREATISSSAEIPPEWIKLVETREAVKELLKMDDLIDLMIPRGSKAFVQYIMDNSRIPVLGHSDGICHIYVDEKAVDTEKAIAIIKDSKCQYPAACNSLETLLVHKSIAEKFLPPLAEALSLEKVELRGDSRVSEIITCSRADESDWATEYLDLILSIKIVDSQQEAIDHIHQYGSGHTDAVITEDKHTAEYFLRNVDASGVYWNCSTRFADGYRYGLGAEVGISTNKIHARGPVGLEGLLSYKWILRGKGQIVARYSGKNGKSFTHKDINLE